MKIMKSEVSFKSDVALVVVGQDANAPSNAAPRDLQGDLQLFQVVLIAGQLLFLVQGGGPVPRQTDSPVFTLVS